ncbi:532_t:CDS:2 [Cetraspora pellucida]|uniref:532_t:CDS:1 n=1 Tax=Cetraspora pellucida TaxID=1433469 RepID=A0A9N9H560_9GLOM|nr:532_t:CDS:2 [Cetraspora pellucida]
MSLKNFSNEDLYLYEPHISLGEGSNLISNKELFSSDNERRSLSLDEGLHLPLDKSPNILHMFTQNKRKLSKLPNINTKKRSKLRKSWQQCPSTFELSTSTTNLASHLRADHRLDKNGPLLPLSGIKKITQLLTVQLDSSQSTLPELFSHRIPLPKKKQNRITSRILAWIIDDMQPFNVLKNDQFHDLLYEAKPQYQFLDRDMFKQKIYEAGLSDKYVADVTDNASSIVKALKNIEILHVKCTAHTIQLGITDGLKQATDLIDCAKALNSFVAGKDKIRKRLQLIQIEIFKEKNQLLNNKNISALDPISNDTITRWNSTHSLLEHLLYLYEAIKKLQKDLAKDKDKNIRKNAKALEELLFEEEDLLGIQELVKLLGPFAHVTTIMGGDQYPTFSMMLPLIKILQDHLFENEAILKHLIVHDVCNEIELSFGNRWDKPGVEDYITTILDPRFKDLSFEPEKLEPMKNELKHRMEAVKNINSTIPSIENRLSSSLLNSLFEKTFQEVCPIENKLKVYLDMPQMIKYDPSDPLYKKHNPLVFWQDNKLTLPLIAQQA